MRMDDYESNSGWHSESARLSLDTTGSTMGRKDMGDLSSHSSATLNFLIIV
jgi:hypothetical protein